MLPNNGTPNRGTGCTVHKEEPPPGEPLPINIAPVPIPDGVPTNSEVRDVVGELMNVRRGGASKMHAEHIKEWPQGIQKEEDPKQFNCNQGVGDAWRLLMRFVNTV